MFPHQRRFGLNQISISPLQAAFLPWRELEIRRGCEYAAILDTIPGEEVEVDADEDEERSVGMHEHELAPVPVATQLMAANADSASNSLQTTLINNFIATVSSTAAKAKAKAETERDAVWRDFIEDAHLPIATNLSMLADVDWDSELEWGERMTGSDSKVPASVTAQSIAADMDSTSNSDSNLDSLQTTTVDDLAPTLTAVRPIVADVNESQISCSNARSPIPTSISVFAPVMSATTTVAVADINANLLQATGSDGIVPAPVLVRFMMAMMKSKKRPHSNSGIPTSSSPVAENADAHVGAFRKKNVSIDTQIPAPIAVSSAAADMNSNPVSARVSSMADINVDLVLSALSDALDTARPDYSASVSSIVANAKPPQTHRPDTPGAGSRLLDSFRKTAQRLAGVSALDTQMNSNDLYVGNYSAGRCHWSGAAQDISPKIIQQSPHSENNPDVHIPYTAGESSRDMTRELLQAEGSLDCQALLTTTNSSQATVQELPQARIGLDARALPLDEVSMPEHVAVKQRRKPRQKNAEVSIEEKADSDLQIPRKIDFREVERDLLQIVRNSNIQERNPTESTTSAAPMPGKVKQKCKQNLDQMETEVPVQEEVRSEDDQELGLGKGHNNRKKKSTAQRNKEKRKREEELKRNQALENKLDVLAGIADLMWLRDNYLRDWGRSTPADLEMLSMEQKQAETLRWHNYSLMFPHIANGLNVLTKDEHSQLLNDIIDIVGPPDKDVRMRNYEIQQINPEHPFEIKRIPENEQKGLGVIATKDISKGSMIQMDHPIVSSPGGSFLNEASIMSLCEEKMCAFYCFESRCSCSLDIMRLGRCEETKVSKIWNQNGRIRNNNDEHPHRIYQLAALMNHDCCPNTMRMWRDKDPTEFCYAARDIKQGEEITMSYFATAAELRLPRQERQIKLLERYKFLCRCKSCSDDPEWSAMRDAYQDSLKLAWKHQIPTLGGTNPDLPPLTDITAFETWYKGFQQKVKSTFDDSETIKAETRILAKLKDPADRHNLEKLKSFITGTPQSIKRNVEAHMRQYVEKSDASLKKALLQDTLELRVLALHCRQVFLDRVHDIFPPDTARKIGLMSMEMDDADVLDWVTRLTEGTLVAFEEFEENFAKRRRTVKNGVGDLVKPKDKCVKTEKGRKDFRVEDHTLGCTNLVFHLVRGRLLAYQEAFQGQSKYIFPPVIIRQEIYRLYPEFLADVVKECHDARRAFAAALL